MSYDMTKMSTESWNNYIKIAKYNQKKLLFHPLYNKKKFVKYNYELHMQKEIDFNKLETFNEKLNGFKLNNKLMRKLNKYADKYKVRDYVSEKIGSDHLIKNYFCKKRITVNDLKELPDSFVLKTTLGSGTNLIIKNKKNVNLKQVCEYMNNLTRLKYGYLHGEFLYNYGKNMIIAEELLTDHKGNIPDDLKAFCFQDNHGKKKKILYVERVIGDDRARIMFNEKWEYYKCDSNFKYLNEDIPRPRNLKKILEIMDRLSEDFNFVRVDLFLIKNKIYFGELTFIPTAGFLQFKDEKENLKWGNYIGDNLLD